MSDPIGPIDRISRPRRVGRGLGVDAAGDARIDDPAKPPFRLPPAEQPTPPEPSGVSAYAAHLVGQGEQRRGLRGGPETLDRARTTYLETEWSGVADRRLRRGKIAKTEI
jgi:hypothetical protein